MAVGDAPGREFALEFGEQIAKSMECFGGDDPVRVLGVLL
jgi:hypothetical protein